MIRYKLDDLGWYQFEWLCQSILKAEFGVGVESWGGHSDLGRDAYFDGPLEIPVRRRKSSGPFIFQAKFVAEANSSGAKPDAALTAAVSAECASIRRRFEKHGMSEVKCYVLMTNSPISSRARARLKAILGQNMPRTRIVIWAGSDLCDLLDNRPNVRVAFPQILGLRDINQLLSDAIAKPIRERSTLQIEHAVELAQVFVPTRAYSRALSVLGEHSFVLLSGPPEMGKSTIARIIGLGKLGEGWACYECRGPDDFFRMKAHHEQSQVFIADDAFGSTEFRPDAAQEWAADLEVILRSLGKRTWLIWTSRPAPLHMALNRMHLQGASRHFPEPGEVLVDASQLTIEEKALILYRHAKAASLSERKKQVLKRNARAIVANPHFTPERARRFVQDRLDSVLKATKGQKDELTAIREAIKIEIGEPTRAMRQSFRSLNPSQQLLLISMLDAGPGIVEQSTVHTSYRNLSSGSESDPKEVAEQLSSHFIRMVGGRTSNP